MKDEDKTRSQLIAELHELRRQKAALSRLPEDTESIVSHLAQVYFENASIGFHQVAMDGQIFNVNSYAADMLGYTTKELTGLSILDIDPFVSADTMEADIKKFVPGGWDSFETVHLKKDGSGIPVEIMGSLMEYEGQQYAFLFIKDISRRKKMAEKLHWNERMLRRIMDIVPSMIFVKNAEGRYLMANQAIAESYGMTVNELVGRRQQDVSPDPDQVERMMADDLKAMKSGETLFIVEEPYKDITGDRRWLQTIKVPCDEDEFGEPAIVGLAMDITERKQAEAVLRENEQLLVNILESMNEGIVVLDREFRYQIFNTAMENISNTPKQEVLG